MAWTGRLVPLAKIRHVAWQRRDIRDAAVILGAAVIVFAFSAWIDVLEKTHEMAKDLVFISCVMGIAMIVYGYRRNQDLTKEVKARRAAELEARNLARHDLVTGLPNRRRFVEKLDEMLSDRGDRQVAVLMLDLDGFKQINDVHGHVLGDQALREFARLISSVLPRDAFLARVGGDEFAIIMPHISSIEEPAALARLIIGTLAEPVTVNTAMVALGAGAGIAVAPDDGVVSGEIVRRADLALYRAKAHGRSMICFFESEMDKYVEWRAKLERELREALTTRSIAVQYQPLFRFGDGIIGFEALARWTSPELGPIEPAVFVAVAEECGLINELGNQLLLAACRDAIHWPTYLSLAFNISPLQLRDPTLGLRVCAILGETGFNPRRLELEVTESALIHNPVLAQKVLEELRSAGVRIALDDFGTGYATMSQLLGLKFDKIKIDRSFVQGLGKNSQSEVIIRATIGLANGLGLTVTAEGIEKPDQLERLRADGCLEGQGFLWGKPVTAGDIPALLDQHQDLRATA